MIKRMRRLSLLRNKRRKSKKVSLRAAAAATNNSNEAAVDADVYHPTSPFRKSSAETLPDLSLESGSSFGDGEDDDTSPKAREEDIKNCSHQQLSSHEGDPWGVTEVKRMADIWQLTHDQHELLLQFGQRVSDVHHPFNNPGMAIRYLLSKDWDSNLVDAAEKQFRNMIDWRLANNADTILEEYNPHPDFVHHYPMGILQKCDRDGDPIFLSRSGATDGVGFLERHGRDAMAKHAIFTRESILQWAEREHPRPFKQLTIVEDLHGLSRSRHLDTQLLLALGEIMRVDQDNYAESAKVIILIRTPSIFRLIWAIIKPFLDARVRNKMIFCGKDNYVPVLKQYLGDDLEAILPDVLIPNGTGRAVDFMYNTFLGGDLHIVSSNDDSGEHQRSPSSSACATIAQSDSNDSIGGLDRADGIAPKPNILTRSLMVGSIDEFNELPLEN